MITRAYERGDDDVGGRDGGDVIIGAAASDIGVTGEPSTKLWWRDDGLNNSSLVVTVYSPPFPDDGDGGNQRETGPIPAAIPHPSRDCSPPHSVSRSLVAGEKARLAGTSLIGATSYTTRAFCSSRVRGS